jgi:hypothetical protein
MANWLSLLLFTVGIVVGGLRAVGGCWCLLELFRKWRSVPEFWGLDWVDIVYRLEREFKVSVAADDFVCMPTAARVALTSGQLWHLVTAKMIAAGSGVPADGWERFVAVIAQALNVNPRKIAPGSRLYADFGMTNDV